MSTSTSITVNKLKRIIYNQHQEIQDYKRKFNFIENNEEPLNREYKSNHESFIVHETAVFNRLQDLDSIAKRYKKERDNALSQIKVYEEYIYVYEQENKQLKKEFDFVSKTLSVQRKRKQTVPESPIGQKFKYKSFINPNCKVCTDLERKLVKEKAETLDLRDKFKQAKTKLKKNIEIYNNNLTSMSEQVNGICSEVLTQSSEVTKLKTTLSNFELK